MDNSLSRVTKKKLGEKMQKKKTLLKQEQNYVLKVKFLQ
jgi:hypothetical protein